MIDMTENPNYSVHIFFSYMKSNSVYSITTLNMGAWMKSFRPTKDSSGVESFLASSVMDIIVVWNTFSCSARLYV